MRINHNHVVSKPIERWFIFKFAGDVALYLTTNKLWSPNKNQAWLMDEHEASDNCGDYGGGCGSTTI